MLGLNGARAAAFALFLCLPAQVAVAQSVTTQDETYKLSTPSELLTAVGPDALGDAVDLYSGALSFRQLDTELPGNSALPVRVARTFQAGSREPNGAVGHFGDWWLEVPRIHATFASSAPWRSDRCSTFIPPQDYVPGAKYSNVYFRNHEYWHGYFLEIPGLGSKEMMRRSADPGWPSTAKAVTQGNIQLTCIPTQVPAGEEGFLATTPDGVKYSFDYRTGKTASTLLKDFSLLPRYMAILYATKVEDRFGNTVTYGYGPQGVLESIEGSDGRRIAFTHRSYTTTNGTTHKLIEFVEVTDATAGTRRWQYHYNADGASFPRLVGVTQPDGGSWAFGLEALHACHQSEEDGCTATGVISSPYGLQGSFTVNRVRHGWAAAQLPPDMLPHFFTSAVTRKELAIPGQASQVWTYSYSGGDGWSQCCGSGASTKWVEVVQPDQSRIRQTYNITWNWREGALEKVEVFAPGMPSPMRVTETVHAAGRVMGYSDQPYRNPRDEQGARVVSTTIREAESTYTTEFLEYDGYDNPTRVRRSTSFAAPVVNEVRSWLNDTALWVLNLPLTTVVNDVEAERTTYTPLRQTHERHVFGLKRVTRAYGPTGLLTSVRDALDHETRLSGHHRGSPQRVDYAVDTADAACVTQVLDDFGDITAQTEQRGCAASDASYATRFGRDAMGRLSRITYPTEDTVAWSPRDLVHRALTATEMDRPAGSWRTRITHGTYQRSVYYNALLRPVLEEEKDTATGLARYIRREFDHDGRTTFESYPAATPAATAGIRSTFDALGRLTRRYTTADETLESIEYLPGNRRRVADGRGNATTTSYQAFGEPAYERALRIEAPEGQTTVIERDVFGNMRSATQSGPLPGGGTATATRAYVYDTYFRLCKRIEPETGQHVIAYDAASNVTWTADGQAGSTASCDYGSVPEAAKTVYSHDARNRVIRADAPGDDADVTTTYWPTGDVKTIANAAGTWTYNYNKRRLLEDETLSADGKSFRLDYGYNPQGHLNQLTYPSNRNVALSPDAFGRATAVGSYATGVDYHPNDTIKDFAYGNSLAYSLTLDARQRPELLRVTSGTTDRIRLLHGYDPADNLASIDDQVDGADDRTLGYDGLNRLTSASGLWGSRGYAYDALNNLRSRTGPNALSYGYNAANQLATVSGAVSRSYLYNPEGQATSDGTGKTFTWNGADRIVSISGVGAYAYDGWGKRIKTTKASGAVEYTVYSKAGTMLYSYKPANGESTDYVYLGNIPLAQVRTVPDPQEPAPQPLVPDLTQNPALTEIVQLSDGLPPQVLGLRDSALRTVSSNQDPPPQTATTTVTYLHADLLSSPIQWSGSTGSLLSQEHYEPYGHKMNGVADKLGYTGHVFDADSGLTYMQARFYDPQVGRFLSTDPVHFTDDNPFTFNRYAYGNNNPYRYTDPDGRAVLQVGGAIGGATLGLVTTLAFDAMSGSWSSPGSYVGAITGGAAAGIALASTFNPAAAGAIGSSVASITQQGIDTGSVDPVTVAAAAAVGATIGAVIPGAKVPGVTAGSHSFAQVAKTAQTKLANGTISSVSLKTVAKASVAAGVEGSTGAAAEKGAEKAGEAAKNAVADVTKKDYPAM